MPHGTLIIGASQAGLQIATSLRDLGYEAPITLLGAEALAPYQRPPLSKGYVMGKDTAASLAFRAPAFYADRGIDLITGKTAAVIDRAARRITTQDGAVYPYDHLALTTGARVRRPPIPGLEAQGVRTLRDLADAQAIKDDLASCEDVVVIGGGFIGLEVAAVAAKLGRKVTVLEAQERLMARAIAPEVSAFYASAHRKRGITVELNVRIDKVMAEHGRATGVLLADGRKFPAQLVILGAGVAPNMELAQAAGLACNGGIDVDDCARTADSRIVAAGDCASQPHAFANGAMIRLESVQNAIDQAKAAAAAILGRSEPNDGPPWFWSDQGDLRLQIAGLSGGYDQTVRRGDPESEAFSLFYYRAGKFIAADSVNKPTDHVVSRKLLELGLPLAPEIAADMSVNLKSLLKARAA